MPGEKMQNGSEYMKDSRNRKCDEDECVTCGHPVTLYGYRDPEDDYNGAVDTIGDEDNGMHDIKQGQIEDDSYKGAESIDSGTYEGIHEDDDNYYHLNQRRHKVRFDEKPHVIVYKNPEPDDYNDQNDNSNDSRVVGCDGGKTAEDVLEHMDGNSSAWGGWIGILITHLCVLFLAIFIAIFRGEFKCTPDGTGGLNWSLILCIILFPQFYITYALVEWSTRPGACRF